MCSLQAERFPCEPSVAAVRKDLRTALSLNKNDPRTCYLWNLSCHYIITWRTNNDTTAAIVQTSFEWTDIANLQYCESRYFVLHWHLDSRLEQPSLHGLLVQSAASLDPWALSSIHQLLQRSLKSVNNQ